MDYLEPRIPGLSFSVIVYLLFFDILYILALAVASGSAVFLFKSLRPYYKYVLPPSQIAQVEKDVWNKAREVRFFQSL